MHKVQNWPREKAYEAEPRENQAEDSKNPLTGIIQDTPYSPLPKES